MSGGLRDPLGGSRLLLLEDNFLVASSLSLMLERLGCEVVGPVATLADARSEIEREQVDAGVLDINVIGGSSYPIAEILMQSGCPVVFVTGYNKDELIPDSLAAVRQLRKPIDESTLEAALVEVFAAWADGG